MAINSTLSAGELPREAKWLIQRSDSNITFELSCDEYKDVIQAKGSSSLGLSDKTSMVIRKSGFASSRTVAILADKAAADINRDMVANLRTGARLDVAMLICAPKLRHQL